MDVAQSREFADFVEQKTFDTPVRAALLRDIRGGAYAPGRMPMPRATLLTALAAIKAPPEVVARARALVFAGATPPVTEELRAAAMAEFLRRGPAPPLQLPTLDDDDLDTLQDAFAADLVPASDFLAATIKAQTKEIERTLHATAFTPQ